MGFLIAQVAKLRRRVREIEGARATAEVVTDAGGPITRSVPAEEQPPPSVATLPCDVSPISVDPEPRPRIEPSPVGVAVPSVAGTRSSQSSPVETAAPSRADVPTEPWVTQRERHHPMFHMRTWSRWASVAGAAPWDAGSRCRAVPSDASPGSGRIIPHRRKTATTLLPTEAWLPS